nr:MAG TPA: hypothetical protein [Caudoviricetes sp.]
MFIYIVKKFNSLLQQYENRLFLRILWVFHTKSRSFFKQIARNPIIKMHGH